MPPTLSELLAALPDPLAEPDRQLDALVPKGLSRHALQTVPIGRLRRLTSLGTLPAQIGAAYLFYWLRGWFHDAEQRQRLLAETHWRTGVKLLDSMSYLRGAIMKIGQTLASLPDVAPSELIETLERLQYNAPPMHWSLLREMVHNELGGDPETLFAQFSQQAFAAASLGQVHRGRLQSGEEVAVKIQYPGIGRTIQADFQNLFLLLLPARLTADWENIKQQCQYLQQRLEQETDYALEAANLQPARALFREEDGIVVPQVFPRFSTSRVLTMEWLEGEPLKKFIDRDPSQQERNRIAGLILRFWYRLLYAGRMLYADFHPGNFLVLPDGRLAVVDFGFVLPLVGAEWELVRKHDRPLTTGRREDRLAVLKEWAEIGDDEPERLQLADQFADWSWRSRYCGGNFDFGDEADFRRGFELLIALFRKRYTRAPPSSPCVSRWQFGWRAMMYQLKANIDVAAIAEEEVEAAGWDRRDYARPAAAG